MKAAELKLILYNKFLRAYKSNDHQFDEIHAEELSDDIIELIYPTVKDETEPFGNFSGEPIIPVSPVEFPKPEDNAKPKE